MVETQVLRWLRTNNMVFFISYTNLHRALKYHSGETLLAEEIWNIHNIKMHALFLFHTALKLVYGIGGKYAYRKRWPFQQWWQYTGA